MTGRVAVGLDVGTTGAKAVAVAEDGRVVAEADAPYAVSRPRPGWSEQDPRDWARASEDVLARVRGDRDVAGIGLSGQMHGLVLLDARQEVLRPAILWNDQRTASQCRRIDERVGRARLIELTGNRALTGFTAPKLMWVAEHEPEVHSRVAHALLPKDFVRLSLTGEAATDVADASGTLWLDVARRQWSDEMLAAVDVDRAWLPDLAESPEVVAKTGDGTPVAAGAGDQAAAAVGVGADRPGRTSIVIGTSGVVFTPVAAYRPDGEARVHTFCHAVPGAWHAMGVMLSAAASLAWLRGVTAPGADYPALTAEADAWPPGSGGLMFLPYLSGERTPHADPGARASFVGLSAEHDRGALVRAVLEGVAFAIRDCVEVLRAAGVDVGTARLTGGGARSDLWARIVASVLGVPVERAAVDQGSAYGAALLGAVAGGMFSTVHEAVDACVKTRDTVDPDHSWMQTYDGAYHRFTAGYPATRPLYGDAGAHPVGRLEKEKSDG